MNSIMNPGIYYAIIAAVAFGIWTVFHEQAAGKIDNVLGAIIVSFTAVLLGALFIIPKLKGSLEITPKGVLFAVLAGVAALVIDVFALKAYGTGAAVSVIGPIIISGSIAVAATIGFFLGETITLMKVAGLACVLIGSGMLSASS